jgi:hypothetical protein
MKEVYYFPIAGGIKANQVFPDMIRNLGSDPTIRNLGSGIWGQTLQ